MKTHIEPSPPAALVAASPIARLIKPGWVLIALFCLSLYVLLYRLNELPAFFTDEGLFLSTAATMRDERLYATRALYQYYSANISVGPPVIVPIALSFWLFGVGLLQGRLVIVGFSLLTLLLGARLADRLFGRWAGPLAWWLILAATWPYFPLFGRMVFGEVPALALLFAALLCWCRYLDNRSRLAFALAGIGLGLAMACKPQMLLIVPTFAVIGLLDLFYYRIFGLGRMLLLGSLAVLTLAFCYAYQIINVGWEVYARDTLSMSIQAGSIINLDPALFFRRTQLGLNERTGLFILALIALGWHMRRLSSRTTASLQLAAPLIFCALWLIWHTLLGVQMRYALIGNVVAGLLVAGMLVELVPLLMLRLRPLTQRTAIALFGLVLILPLPTLIRFPQLQQPSGVVAMGAYIRTSLPPAARIETLDWGMDLFSDRLFGHMPIPLHLALIEALNYPDEAQRRAAVPYDFRPNQPDYILIGPTSELVPAYVEARDSGELVLVVRFEDYALYRVGDQPKASAP